MQPIFYVFLYLGAFHSQMSFMHAIYKRLQCSTIEDLLSEATIEDLLSEAGLITSGNILFIALPSFMIFIECVYVFL